MPFVAASVFLLVCVLGACKPVGDHAIDAGTQTPTSGSRDASSTDAWSSVRDAGPPAMDAPIDTSNMDASSNMDAQIDASIHDAAIDAAPTARIDYWPCTQIAQISGAKSEYYVNTLVPVDADFAMGADMHGLITNQEIDVGQCSANPGAYTCSNFVLPNGAVGGYDAVNGKVLAVCGSNYSSSRFGNKVAVWGSSSSSGTSYAATVDSVTCSQTATLSFTSVNDSYSFTIKYELYSVPTGERAIIGHLGVTAIDVFDNYAGPLNGHANCSSFYTCSGMPTGIVTNDVLGNTYYNNQLLVTCQATYNDTTLSETFTQGSSMARVVHWKEQ